MFEIDSLLHYILADCWIVVDLQFDNQSSTATCQIFHFSRIIDCLILNMIFITNIILFKIPLLGGITVPVFDVLHQQMSNIFLDNLRHRNYFAFMTEQPL